MFTQHQIDELIRLGWAPEYDAQLCIVEMYNRDATLAGLAKLGPYLVPNFDSETGDGIREFSSRICESCGTSLAGYRAKFATLEESC